MRGIKLKKVSPMGQVVRNMIDLENRKEEALKEAAIESSINDYSKKIEENSIYSKRDKMISEAEAERSYIQSLRTSLLIEAFGVIFKESCPGEYSDVSVYENMMNSFIKEKGSLKLLKEFEINTSLTASIASIINDEFEYLKSNGMALTESQKISRKDKFLDNINSTVDAKGIGEIIQKRVSSTVDSFIDKSIDSKKKIEDIIDNSKKKIEDAETEELEESARLLATRRVNEVLHGNSQTVLEMMVSSLTRKVLAKENGMESYITESGIDMDGVMKRTVSVYTFLEMCASLELDTIDESKLEEIKEDFKK